MMSKVQVAPDTRPGGRAKLAGAALLRWVGHPPRRVHRQKTTRDEINRCSLTGQLLQYLFPQFLRLPEKLLIVDEQTVQLERLVRPEFFPQNHVAHVYGVGQRSVFGEFFQRGRRIVVVHGFIVAPPSRRLCGWRLARPSGRAEAGARSSPFPTSRAGGGFPKECSRHRPPPTM